MQRLYQTFFAALLSMLLLPGCKKLVTISEPQTSLLTSEVFASDATAGTALTSIYAYMTSVTTGQWANGGTDLYTGLSSDELVDYLGATDSYIYAFEANNLLNNTLLTESVFWAPGYKVIYYANAILEGVAAAPATALSDSARNQLNGEAKFIRAYTYFYLTNLFGDVPMPLSTDFNLTALLPRSPQANVYGQIVKDLQDAQSLLHSDFSVSAGERIRPNKQAATALLARVYLYQGDYTDADQQASAVIGDPQYALTSDPANTFLANSTEAIFQLVPNYANAPYAPNDTKYYIPLLDWSNFSPIDQMIYLDPSVYSSIAPYLAPPFYLSPSQAAAFEPGDKRKSAWLKYSPTPNQPPYTGDTMWWSNKYQVGTADLIPSQYYMILRLAEQYFIRAEAKVKESDLPAAIADINTIRTRAGLSNTTATSADELLAAIAQERRVELFAEWGDRWLDLKRTGKASSTLDTISYKPRFQAYQLLYPIPSSEIKNDPNLTQNPGY